jgi:hypothetical protein
MKEALKLLHLETTPEGYVFGTMAQRCGKEGFWTTGRGKKEAEVFTYVHYVDHEKKVVWVHDSKATLNAPLLSHIFLTLPQVYRISHTHSLKISQLPCILPVLDYAPPGTVRDSIRDIKGSFIIRGHGCFLLSDKEGNLL